MGLYNMFLVLKTKYCKFFCNSADDANNVFIMLMYLIFQLTHVLFYFLHNAVECSQISPNPLAVVCNSCSNATSCKRLF
jgi:hypothetical protein